MIRAFGREPEFVAGFRQVLSRGLAATNRSLFYSALYTPTTAILSAIAVTALLAAGTQPALGATRISLGTLTAFLLLLQRFFQPITALGEEWQTVQGAMAGAERIFGTLALPPDEVPAPARAPARADQLGVVGRAQRRRIRLRQGSPGSARSVPPGETRRTRGAGGAYRRGEDQRPPPSGGALPSVGGDRRRGRPRPRPARRSRAQPRARRGAPGGPAVLGHRASTTSPWATRRSPRTRRTRRPPSREPIRSSGRCLRATGPCSAAAGAAPGAHLSAGQQQLLALARALVHRPAVLLLDEATAAIDNASDAAFRAALRDRVLPRGCAVVTVAHRLGHRPRRRPRDRPRQGTDRGRRSAGRARRQQGSLCGAPGAGGGRLGLAPRLARVSGPRPRRTPHRPDRRG